MGPNDVLYGRRAHDKHHVGNTKHRKMVEDRLREFVIMDHHIQRHTLAEDIVKKVQKLGGRFLRRDIATQGFVVMSDQEAIMMTGQYFRDSQQRFLRIEEEKGRESIREEERKAKESEAKILCSSQSDRIIRKVIPSCRESARDVLYGNGAHVDDHVGTIKYRKMVQDALIEHSSTDNYIENYEVAVGIVKKVQEGGGRFLKRDATTNEYAVMCDGGARTMTIELFKDCKPAPKKEEQTLSPSPSLCVVPDGSAAMPASTTNGNTQDQVLFSPSDSLKHDISQQANTPTTQCNTPPYCVR